MSLKSGEDFSLILPKVNTPNMNEFLSQISKSLRESKAIIVMGCAGWHRSKDLRVPENIEIYHLPPYSPELNPIKNSGNT